MKTAATILLLLSLDLVIAGSPDNQIQKLVPRITPVPDFFNDPTLPQKTICRLRCNVATSSAPDAIIIPAGTLVTVIPDPTQARFVHARWHSHHLVLSPSALE